jgi:hypothetical protein
VGRVLDGFVETAARELDALHIVVTVVGGQLTGIVTDEDDGGLLRHWDFHPRSSPRISTHELGR